MSYNLSPLIDILWLEDGDHVLESRVSGFSAADHLVTIADTTLARVERLKGSTGAIWIPAARTSCAEKAQGMTQHRIYRMSFARIYPLLVAKAERKGRTKAEVDQVIHWLTGYDQGALASQLAKNSDYETFFVQAPALNPARFGIKGIVCGVRVEEIAEPVMREIRYLDKLIDELARGKAIDKILLRRP